MSRTGVYWPHLATRLAVIAAALGLLAWVVSLVDLGGVLAQVLTIGLPGFCLVLALFAVEFYADVVLWQCLLPSPRERALHWSAVLYRVRLVGEALNVLTPLGGMGGEPVKALILRQRHGIDLSLASASLVLAKTINVLALMLFLLVGLVLIHGDPRIDGALRAGAVVGLAALSLGMLGFVIVQCIGFGRVLGWLGAGPESRLTRAAGALAVFDRHLLDVYRRRPGRFLSAFALGFLNWTLGALSVMVTARLMGHPLDFEEAWVIEAMTQGVRAGAFFIPAGLGAQEGIQVLVVGALTGRPELGLALALVRRGRELVWLLLGTIAGWGYLPRERPTDAPPGK